jgi:hypothetical protein
MIYSFKKWYLFILLLVISSRTTVYSQTVFTTFNPSSRASNDQSEGREKTRIKWTWQLPAQIRDALNKSQFSSWYIEKIVWYNLQDQPMYRFYINNGNLVDADHHDSFLKKDCLEVSNDGIILSNKESFLLNIKSR